MSWLVANKNSSGKVVSWLYRYRVGNQQKERSTRKKDHASAVHVQKQWDACRLLYGKFPDEMVTRTIEGSEIKAQIDRFLTQKKAEIKPSTVTRYQIQFRAVEEFLASRSASTFSQLNTSLMKDYKFARLNDGKSHKTVAEELMLFRSMIRGLVAEELLEKDPVRVWPEIKKRIPARPETLGPYSDQEVQSLLEYFKERCPEFHPVAMVAFYAGLRLGEIKNLSVGDINLNAQVARVFNQKSLRDTKSAYREITLHPDLLAMITARCKSALPTAFVFPEMRMHAKHWPVRQLQKACKALGIQYRRFHGCRHTFASKAANSGIGLPKVQAALGHTNLATTQRYVKNDQIDAAEIRMINFGK